jgi:hypothetical protein
MLSAVLTSFEEIFIRSWWVILFILLCYMLYEQGLRQSNRDFAKLHHQYLELQKEKKLAYAIQEDLLLQVNSQSDPAWVELTLIKGLGLVPEGQIKVVFTSQE